MAPHCDSNIKMVADVLVVIVQKLITVMTETKHRCMNDDIVGPAGLSVSAELQHGVNVLIRDRHNRPGLAGAFIRSDGHVRPALVQRHGPELALFARDEKALDVQ